MSAYECVIGLEVHVELKTQTKIFCGCTTKFGGKPNTHVCPVCLGMPGTLPVLNKKVLEYAMRVGIATDCTITKNTKFDRKNYFYPDLPKAYQISQLYLPICRNGHIDIEASGQDSGDIKRIGIHEIHMEEDAGKLIHDPWTEETMVDYNRCGVPLLEIVSEPDMRSAEEVIAYLTKLRLLLSYLGVSDCRMQEGSLRADINLSIRPVGAKELGTRTEMKNMTSFKAIGRAIEGEMKRQIDVVTYGGRVRQETRRWDDNKDTSFAMRSKENAQDYRYFPDPDLVPVIIKDEWLEKIREKQPELRDAKYRRYVDEIGIPEYDASILTGSKKLADVFEETSAKCGKPKEVSNYIMVEAMRLLKEVSRDADDFEIDTDKFAKIIELVGSGKINKTSAKEAFEELFKNNTDPEEFIRKNGLFIDTDPDAIRNTVLSVIDENQKSVDDYRAGKDKAVSFLIGQCMKALKGKADPAQVGIIMREELKKI